MNIRMATAPGAGPASSVETKQAGINAALSVPFGTAGVSVSCAQEPIHIPGTIQPHGALLVFSPSCDWTVIAASRNATGMLNASPSAGSPSADPSSADGVIGCSIGGILGLHFAEAVQSRFQSNRLRGRVPWQSTLKLGKGPQAFDVAVHAHAGLILVELEPVSAKEAADAQTAIRQHQEIIVDLRETGSNLEELALVAARGVRLLTGYERVVIYRFDADWNGQAIAEDKVADWEHSLSGVRFPASDIPAQARELYRHSPMRWVPDRDATPVPLDIDPA